MTDKIPGGLADNREYKEFDPEQLAMGIQVELEHTDDIELAREIAMDHLVEFPDYYTYLKKMEEKLDDEKDDGSVKKVMSFNTERIIEAVIKKAREDLPVFTDSAIKNKLYSISQRYNKIYSDQYWTVPNDIIKQAMRVLPNLVVYDTKYDHTSPPKYKKWFLIGAYKTPKGRMRALWSVITASGAGSINDPLDKYDVTNIVETVSPNNIKDYKARSYLMDLGIE